MILGHYRTGLLIAALLCASTTVAAQGAASALSDTELSALRSRISEERALLEQQLVHLREQQTRLDELERRATSLSSASAASAPAAENPTVGTRFANASVTLGGSLRTTVTTSSARMQPDATPFLVLPSLPGVAEGTTKIDARLSTLLLSIRGAEVGGFQLGGLIVAQLFDGDLLSGKYGLYPGLAYVEASNNDWRFALGLQSDVFSPRIPRMVDGMSAMAGSGNAGNSTKPQLRVERFLSLGEDRITLQGALADPEPSNIAPASLASTENTGTPNVEGRIAWTRGSVDRSLSWVPYPEWELGLSAATGSFRSFSAGNTFAAYDTRVSGLSLDGALRLGQRLGLQGELYNGRALAPYLGSIFQTVVADHSAVRSEGGWGEVSWWWSPVLHSHAGYGMDRAWASGSQQPAIRANRTSFANVYWDPGPMTTLGIEATWRKTDYGAGLSNQGFALMLSSELRF